MLLQRALMACCYSVLQEVALLQLQVPCCPFPAHILVRTPPPSTTCALAATVIPHLCPSPLLPVSAHGHEGSGPAHGSPAQDKANHCRLRRHRPREYPWGGGESIPPVSSGDRDLGPLAN